MFDDPLYKINYLFKYDNLEENKTFSEEKGYKYFRIISITSFMYKWYKSPRLEP